MKKFLLSLIAICSFVSPVLAQQDTVVEEIVARVNNSIITRADLRRNHEQTAQDSKEMNLSQTADRSIVRQTLSAISSTSNCSSRRPPTSEFPPTPILSSASMTCARR